MPKKIDGWLFNVSDVNGSGYRKCSIIYNEQQHLAIFTFNFNYEENKKENLSLALALRINKWGQKV